MADPNHVDYETMQKWAKSQWYRNFDMELINKRLENILRVKADLKFDNIIKMTKSRLGRTLNMALTAMTESEIVACKQKGALEFVYTNYLEVNYKPIASDHYKADR